MRGKKKYISSPKILFELFNKYEKWAKSNPVTIEDYVGKDAQRVLREKPRCLTFEGFENFVANIDGMPLDLGDYFANRNNAYTEYSPICSRIRRIIRQDQIEGGMAGVYNPSITQRLNSLVERSSVEIKEQPLFPDVPADDSDK